MVSSVDNYSSFEKQFLACYWVLVENECLTMGYQVHELLMMNWVLPDPSSQKTALHHQVEVVYMRRPEQALKAKVSYVKELPKCL